MKIWRPIWFNDKEQSDSLGQPTFALFGIRMTYRSLKYRNNVQFLDPSMIRIFPGGHLYMEVDRSRSGEFATPHELRTNIYKYI